MGTQCFAPDARMSQGWSQTRGWVRATFSRHQLLFVNCGVSVGLSGLGDLLQQRIEAGRQRGLSSTAIYRPLPAVNWSRTANMLTSFGLTAGLLCHHWYKLLDNFLPGRTFKTIVVKIAWDQIKDTQELGTQL